ncbi:MAG TPA: hypothetical protein VG755_16590 [Nannocystaceae bacterium]|nr:hypothetical protein [Nannocystaceae bacterium]
MRRASLAALITIACASTSTQQADEESSGGPIDLPAPDFLEPAGAELHLEVTRDVDVDLDVSGVEQGRTVLAIDGKIVGTLLGSSLGELSSARLLLYMRGGMVPGQHTIQLSTFDDVETEGSEVVQVFLEPVAAPTIAWEASGDALADGDALLPEGDVLGLVDVSLDPPQLHMWPTDARGWDRTRTRTLALPGLRTREGEGSAAVSARRAGDRVRVAWRDGVPGAAIMAVDVAWESGDDGDPIAALVPDASWLGAREWVDVVRPVLAGDVLLAELMAPGDAEQPRPGDRVVASVVLASDTPGTPQLVQLGVVDIDRIARVVDPLIAATGSSDTLLVRRDRREPIVLDVQRSSHTIRRRSSATVARNERWTALVGVPVATAAAFGSRIVAGLTNGGETLTIGLVSDRGVNEPALVELALAPAAVGDPALAWVDGVPIVLVPRGDADALAVPITSATPSAQPLAGLACDAIVGPAHALATDEQRGEVACLRARALGLVVLRLE